MLGNFLVAAQLAASQEVLSSMELAWTLQTDGSTMHSSRRDGYFDLQEHVYSGPDS
jgi:hypothetical protein